MSDIGGLDTVEETTEEKVVEMTEKKERKCYRWCGCQGLRWCHQGHWFRCEISGIRCNPEVFWCVQCPDSKIFIRDPNFEKSAVFFQWSWNIRKRPGRNTENSWYDCKIHVCKFCNSRSN